MIDNNNNLALAMWLKRRLAVPGIMKSEHSKMASPHLGIQ